MTLATRVEKEPKEAFVEIPHQCRRTELKYRLFAPSIVLRSLQHFLEPRRSATAQALPWHWQRLSCRYWAPVEM